MPIYEYQCPGSGEPVIGNDSAGGMEAAAEDAKEKGPHVFEKIVPMSDMDKPQLCPQHGKECQRVEFSTPGTFQWGKEVVHWAAGLGHRGGFV